MTKRDIVVQISQDTGMVQADVLAVIQCLLDALRETVVSGQKVELCNFGVFEVVVRRPRTGRNPKNPSHEIVIPARAVVKFRSGRRLQCEVRELSADRFERKEPLLRDQNGEGKVT